MELWVENQTASGLCYPWSLRLPFCLLHDSLPLTLACEVHRRLKELQDSSLWDFPWLSSWARRVAWWVHCPYRLLQHFFHRTRRGCAARMGLKVDFKWFLLMSDTESVKDTSLILMNASAVWIAVCAGLQHPMPSSGPMQGGRQWSRTGCAYLLQGLSAPLFSSADWHFFQLMVCFNSDWYSYTVFSWVCCRPYGPFLILSDHEHFACSLGIMCGRQR